MLCDNQNGFPCLPQMWSGLKIVVYIHNPFHSKPHHSVTLVLHFSLAESLELNARHVRGVLATGTAGRVPLMRPCDTLKIFPQMRGHVAPSASLTHWDHCSLLTPQTLFICHPALLRGYTIPSAIPYKLLLIVWVIPLLFSPLFFSVLLNLVEERALAGVLSAIKGWRDWPLGRSHESTIVWENAFDFLPIGRVLRWVAAKFHLTTSFRRGWEKKNSGTHKPVNFWVHFNVV